MSPPLNLNHKLSPPALTVSASIGGPPLNMRVAFVDQHGTEVQPCYGQCGIVEARERLAQIAQEMRQFAADLSKCSRTDDRNSRSAVNHLLKSASAIEAAIGAKP